MKWPIGDSMRGWDLTQNTTATAARTSLNKRLNEENNGSSGAFLACEQAQLWVKPGSHIPPTYLRRSRRLQLTTFGDLSKWVPGASAMDRRHTQICANWRNFNHFTCKYGSIRLTGVRCVRRWCSHKLFSSPTTASLPAKLNSAQLRRQAGDQCLG